MQDLQFALIRPPELILQDQLLDDNEKWDEIRQGLQQAGRKDEEIEQVHQNLIKSGKLQEPGFFGGIGNSIQDFLGANNASEENRQKVLKREEPEESYTDWLMNKAEAAGEHLENAAIGIQNLPKSAKSTFLDLIEGGALRAKHDAYAVPNIFGEEDPTAPIKQKIEEKYGTSLTPPPTPEPVQQTPRPDVIPQDLSVAPEAMSPGELQQLGGKMMRGELTDEEKTRLKAYRNHLDLTSPTEIVPTKDQPKVTADTFIDWTKEHRPKPLDPGLRLTIKSKLERKEPLSEEDYQALDEWKDQFPKPFKGDNTELGEVIQSLPSTALALGEGAIMATPGLLGRNPNAARAGMMYGSSDAASSMNVAGAVNEGRMFFKRNAPLGPEREQIQALLYANYPQEDQLESLQRQMEKTITQKTNEYRWRYSSPFDMLSALPVGRGAKSMKDFLLRNISWDSATEGMTGAMDYMAQRWAIRDALKEALGDKISDDQALLFSKDEFLKSAALEAASGAIIAGPAAVGEYTLYGEDFKIAAEADRQRSQAKKVAKSDSGKQVEAESMQEYQQQILQAQEEAQANDGQQLLEAIKEEEAQEKAEAGILSGEKIEEAQDLDAMLEGGALESEEESEQILQGEQLQDTGETIEGEDSEVVEDALDLEAAPPTKEEQDANILAGPPEATTDDDIQLLYDQQPAEQTGQQESAEILTKQEELGGKRIRETEKLLQESTVPNQVLTSRQRDEFRKALEEGKITVKGNAPLVRQAVQLLSRNNARLGLHMADGKIHVHDNVEQARKANPGMVIPEDAEAHIDPSTGHIHFIADQIQGSNVEQAALRAIRVAEHEFVGHKGLRDVFPDPKQLDTFLDRMYDIYHREINQYRNAQDKLDATLPEGQRPPRMSDAVATEEWIVQRYAEMGQPVYDWQSKLAKRFAGKSPRKMAHYELREIFDRIVRGQRHGAGDSSPLADSATSPPESAVPSSTRRTKPEPPAVPPAPAVQGDADLPEESEAPAVTPKPVQAPVEQPDPAPQVETPDVPPQPPPPPSETAPDYNPNELTMDFEAGLPKAKKDLQVENPKPEPPEAVETPGVELEAAPTPEITAPEAPDPQAPEPQAVEDMPEADAPEAEATEELVVQPPEVGEAPEVGSVVEKPTRDLNRDADELAPVRDTFNGYSSAQKEMAAQQFLTKTGKVGKDAREIRDAQTFEELSAKNQRRLAALLRDPNNKLPKVELPQSEATVDTTPTGTPLEDASTPVEEMERTAQPEMPPPTPTVAQPAATTATAPPEPADTSQELPQPLAQSNKPAQLPADIAMATGDAEARLVLMDLPELSISHDLQGNENPDFVARGGVQPRNRVGISEDTKLQDIVTKPDAPRFLTNSVDPGVGAPIVNEQGAVLSGNNRSRALTYLSQQADRQDFWERYDLSLLEKADELGFSKPTLTSTLQQAKAEGRRPVLVRQITTPLEEQQITAVAKLENVENVEAQSVQEQATEIANKMSSTDAANLITENGLAITRSSMAEKLRVLMGNPGDTKRYFNEDNSLTPEGERLMSLAMLKRGYGDRLLNEVAQYRQQPAQIGALVQSVPSRIRMNEAIDALTSPQQQQALRELDLTDQWMDAIAMHDQAQDDLRVLPDFSNLEEVISFDNEITPILIRSMRKGERKASATAMRRMFDQYNNRVADSSTQLLATDPPNKTELVQEIFGDGQAQDTNQMTLFSRRVTPKQDRDYLAALAANDMVTAQKMVNEAAKSAGYDQDNSHRIDHQAPNSQSDVSLANLKGSGLVPENYFQRPDLYAYDAYSRESLNTISTALNRADEWRRAGNEKAANNVRIKVYRAKPKNKEGHPRNGDWVTPSKAYAELHKGDRKDWEIQSVSTPLKNLYWDGNDPNELGYDNGENLVYADTKNNRKRIDAVIYDNEGNPLKLSERFNKRIPTTMFSRRGNLMAIHEMSASRLSGILRDGSLIAPSLAVTSKENPRTGFGDVSLLFDSSVVDPKQGGQTYSGDVYSRRMPKPIYALKPKEKRELAQQMAPKLEPLGFDQRDARYQMSMYLTPRDYIGGRSEAIMLALPENWQTEYPDGNNMLPVIAKIDYLKEQGRLPELPQFVRNDPKNYNYASEVNQILNQAIVGQDYLYQAEGTPARADYDAWLGNYLDQFYQPFDAQFEDGWNANSGRPRLKPWTPENVLKHMTGRIRNQESTMTHSIGQVKASSTRQFKNLDEIRESEDRLVNEQQLEDHKDRTKTEDRLMDLGHELLDYHSYVSNTFAGLDEIHEAMSRYFRKTRNHKTEQPGLMGMALREQGYKDLPLNKVDEAVQLAREIREAPVKYFESKPQRLVNTREIEAVVAPPNALSAANVQELERLGIPLVEYDPSIDGDREAKMREAAEQQDVLFSRKKPVALTPQQLQGLPARLNANAILDGQEVPNIEGGSYTRSLGLTPANKKVQNMDIADYLDQRSKQAYGIEGTVEETPELYEAVALTMNEEINRQLQEDSSGSGWYDRAMADAMGMYTVLHPELATNPDASMIFKSLLAITSQGETVFKNGQLADGLYQEYKQTGRIPQTVEAQKKAAMQENLGLLQDLLDKFGAAQLNQLFNTPMPVRQINQLRESFNRGAIDELADTTLVGSAVFGPKIGVFNGNLNRNFDLLTIDIWMNRTLSRYFGQIKTFSPEKDARYRQELNALWDNQPFEPSRTVKKRPKQNKLINRWAKETLLHYAASVPTGKMKADGKPEMRSYHPDRKTDQSQKAKHIIENLFETNDAPTNANRKRARDLVQRVHQIRQKNGEIPLNTADLQAILWYYEKDLFRKLGGGSKASEKADYVDAAESIIQETGDGQQRISAQNIRARRGSEQPGQLAALRQQLPQIRDTGQVGGGTGAGSDRVRQGLEGSTQGSEQRSESDLQRDASGDNLFSRSPEFRSWFGNSQAVDADGNPLVLYHGTGSDIEAFDLNKAQDKEGRKRFLGLGAGKLYLTGSPQTASGFAENSSRRRLGNSPNVLPVYARLENPITQDEYDRRYEALTGTYRNDEAQSQQQRDRRIRQLDTMLKNEGVDGIWEPYYNQDGSLEEVGQVAVFDPTQIKSIYNEAPTNTDNRLLYSRRPNDLKQERIQLIEQLRQGQITNEQYDQWIDENDPIMTLGEKYGIEGGVPTPATDAQIEAHTGGIKNPGKAVGKVLDKDVFLEDGDLVANRLDIPAYTDFDSWVVTLHDGSSKGGKALAYGAAARIQGHPKLNGRVEFATVPKQAFRIAGGGGKSTIARMRGGYVNQDRDSLAAEAQRIVREKDPAWIEVGMNPYRASYFYDKATGTPVNTASEVIQVGALVLAKDPEYGSKSDYSFVDSATGRTIQFSRRLPNRQELAQRAMAPFRLIEQMLDPLGRVEDRTELLSIFSLAKGEIERTQRIARQVRKNLDKAKNKEEVYEYLTNRVSPQTITNEVDRLAAMETKGLLNEFGQRLVDAGRISQESYDKYKDQYLPQVYLAHLTDDFSFLSTGRKPSPMGYTKERKLDDSEPEHALIKSLLGEIKNPAYLAGRSLSTVGRDLALLDMMEAIHLNPNWALADQFAGWSYHDEMEDIINSLGLSDSLRQQFKLNQIKPAPQFMNMIPAVDQVIGRLEADIDEAVKTQQQQVKEVALYTKRILAGFRNRLQDALPNQGRPHLEAPKLKRAANQVDKLFDLIAGVELPATDNQHLAAQYLEMLLQDPAISGVVQRLGQASKEVSQMRGKSVTSTYLQDEADRLRQQVIPQANGEYKQALEEMTRRMDQLIAQVHRPNTLFKADTWKRMPASARYGALRNMIVHKDIYDTVVGVTQMSEADPTFWDKWIAGDHSVANQYQQFQKLMSVPANIPAVARNFISNKIWMYVITGMGPIDIPRYWLKAVNEMRKPVEDSRYRQVAEKYGLGMGTFSNAELNLLTNELKAWQRDVEAEAQGRGVIGKITRNSLGRALDFGRFLGTWVGDQYQAVESLDKMAVMMYSMEQKGMSDAEAVQEAEDALFDYSMVRPSVRQIRTSIIGAPFITYSLKVAETLARRFQKEPVKISLRMLPILAAQYGMISSVVKFFQDLEEDDWDEIGQEYTKLFEKGYEFYQRDDIAELKRNTGYWMENNPAVVYWPWKDSNGKWQLYNTGYLIPWSMYTNMMQYLFEGKPFEAIGEAGLGQSFIPQIVMGLVTGVDPFTGQPIMDDHLSLNDKEVQKYVWATNQLTPGMFRGLLDMVPKYAANAITGDNYNVPSRAGQGLIRQLLDAAAQEEMIPYLYGDSSITDSRGNLKRTLGQSAARAFGQNLYSVDPLYNQSRALPWKKGDLDRLKQQANRELKQIMGNKGMSEKQRLQRYQERYQYWFGEGGALGRTMQELERVARPIPPELLVQ